MRKISGRGRSARTPRTTLPGSPPRRRVLYVEDEKDNYDVLAYRLAERYKILWARTDRAAIDLIGQHGNELYAILMDIQLMGSALDGIQLTRAIRDVERPQVEGLPAVPILPDIPIIFLTGYIARYSREELADAGGNALLGKPVDFHELTEALRELGGPKQPTRAPSNPAGPSPEADDGAPSRESGV